MKTSDLRKIAADIEYEIGLKDGDLLEIQFNGESWEITVDYNGQYFTISNGITEVDNLNGVWE